MTKRDLVVRIASETGIPQDDVHTVIQKFLDYISDALGQAEHVEFREFGVFDVVTRKPRVGRNPKRPTQTVQIPKRNVIKFKPGKRMKALVAKL
jgi:integration host factor subunit beta